MDIDLNYVGQLDRQKMLLERPEVEKALEAIFQREGVDETKIASAPLSSQMKWSLL